MRRGHKFSTEGEEEEEEANWQDSYSDLMTDLLAIFVVLFSFAMLSQSVALSRAVAAQQKKIVIFEEASSQSVLPGEDGILNGEEYMQNALDSEDNFVDSLNDYINENGLSEEMSATKEESNIILLRVGGSVLFEPGKADISSNAEQLLRKLSGILSVHADTIKVVRIEGHTDDRPMNSVLYNSNWELSTFRAVNVLKRMLEISELDSKKFSAVGYGEFHPIVDNDTAINRAKNRRVDFIIETITE